MLRNIFFVFHLISAVSAEFCFLLEVFSGVEFRKMFKGRPKYESKTYSKGKERL